MSVTLGLSIRLLRATGFGLLAGLLLLGSQLRAADAPALKRWAVLASPAARATGLDALVTVPLSRAKEIELVEREELDKVVAELGLATLFDADPRAKRLQLAALLKADGLLVLDQHAVGEQQFIRVTMAETKYGARLRVEFLPWNPAQREAMVAQVVTLFEQTRQRFRAGVTRVIGVPSFVSKNLTHEHDHLQAGYANLLQSSLTRAAGVAVIELEEARRIGQEIAIGPTDIHRRMVPVYVEGQFRMASPRAGAPPAVQLGIEISDGKKVLERFEHANLPLSEVPKVLLGRVAEQVLHWADARSIQPLSAEQEFARLAARAKAFSTLGAWDHSIGMREAALLLRPDDVELRLALLADYHRWQKLRRADLLVELYQKSVWDTWPQIVAKERGGCARVLDDLLSRWQIIVGHNERLLEQKGVNLQEAMMLLFSLRDAASQICIPTQNPDGKVEAAFLAHVDKVRRLVSGLDYRTAKGTIRNGVRDCVGPTAEGPSAVEQPLWMQQNVVSATLTHCLVQAVRPDPKSLYGSLQQNPAAQDRLIRFLEEHLQGELPHPTLAVLFQPFGQNVPEVPRLAPFFQRMLKSKSAATRYLGRYAQVSYKAELAKDKNPPEVQQEIDALLAIAKQPSPEILQRAGAAAFTKYLKMVQARQFERLPGTGQATQPKGPATPVAVAGSLKFMPVISHLYMQKIVPCDEQMDVTWSAGDVQIWKNGESKQLLAAGRIGSVIIDVAWDGTAVWVATSGAGLWVIAPDGTVIARSTSEEIKLPPYDSQVATTLDGRVYGSLRIECVAPGRCILIGALGPHQRLWFADAARKDKQVTVRVFHEATRVATDAGTPSDTDTHQIFTPTFKCRYQSREGGDWLLVGRSARAGEEDAGRLPLSINLETYQVAFFSLRLATRGATRDGGSFHCHDGKLFQATQEGVDVYHPPTATAERKWRKQTLLVTAGLPENRPLLIKHRGMLYRPGSPWYRIDSETLKVVQLGGTKAPPARTYGTSATLGMVMVTPAHQFLRVVADGDEPPPRDAKLTWEPQISKVRLERGEKPLGEKPIGHSLHTFDFAILPGGKQMLTLGQSVEPNRETFFEVTAWDLASGRRLEQLVRISGKKAVLTNLSLSPDGNTLEVSGTAPRPGIKPWKARLWTWDLTTGKPPQATDIDGPYVPPLFYSSDGRHAIRVETDGTATLINRSTQEKTALKNPAAAYRAAFAPNGKSLAIGCQDGFVTFWDLASKRQIAVARPLKTGRTAPTGISGTVTPTGLCFSGDSQNVIVAYDHGRLYTWDPKTEKTTERANLGAHLFGLALSPDGSLVAVAQAFPHRVTLWRVSDWSKVGEFETRDGGYVRTLKFADDSQTLITAALRGMLKFWDVADPAKPREITSSDLARRLQGVKGR